MKRKPVYLEPEQERRLKELAERGGVPEAEVVRQAVEEYLREHERQLTAEENPLLEIIGIVPDPDAPRDGSIRYKEYLYGKPKTG